MTLPARPVLRELGDAVVLAERRSAPVTDLAERLFWTTFCVLLFLAVAALMLRGWRRRAQRQADVPALPEPPPGFGADPSVRLDGVYVTTTTEGDWLDRVVVHGLGARSRAEVTVEASGVLFTREGAPEVFVPAATVAGVRLDRGMAGKFTERDGLVVLTWTHHGHRFDTGFRPDEAQRRDELLDAVDTIREEHP